MASKITSLDKDTVRLICSGQVVVDLATAIKELVENALDSAATSIEVRLVDHGASEIECSDDGCGISPRDFINLGKRHSTSKLSDFDSLQNVSSLGFRGEALASLCELAGELSVVTRCRSEKVGNRLIMARDGSTSVISSCARNIGTTVTVKGLFSALPVRRVNLERNLKRHYSKALQMLQGYALVATHCRLRVTLQVMGKRTTVMAVQSGRTIVDTVSSIFGAKFAQSLAPFNSMGEDKLDKQCTKSLMVLDSHKSVIGLVSRMGDGVGRSEGDRQFLFCNDRPIDAPKIVRAVNDTWRLSEMKHKPAFIIYLRLPTEEVDLNISPNKREVLIDNEAALLCSLKLALNLLWEGKQSQPGAKKSLGRRSMCGPGDNVLHGAQKISAFYWFKMSQRSIDALYIKISYFRTQ